MTFVGYWLPPLLWMGLIWSVSSDIGSADNTAGAFGWIVTALVPWATPAQIEMAHAVVRKLGHLAEYAILAALWFRTLNTGRRLPPTQSALAALAISVTWAIVDEVHQSFVPSRGASSLDVILDSTGATLCLLALRLRNTRFSGPRSIMEGPLIAQRKTSGANPARARALPAQSNPGGEAVGSEPQASDERRKGGEAPLRVIVFR